MGTDGCQWAKLQKDELINPKCIKISPLPICLYFLSSQARKYVNSMSTFEVSDVLVAMDQSEPNYDKGSEWNQGFTGLKISW